MTERLYGQAVRRASKGGYILRRDDNGEEVVLTARYVQHVGLRLNVGDRVAFMIARVGNRASAFDVLVVNQADKREPVAATTVAPKAAGDDGWDAAFAKVHAQQEATKADAGWDRAFDAASRRHGAVRNETP